MAEPVEDSVSDDDFDDSSHVSKWAILVDTVSGAWLITQVSYKSEVGDYEVDHCINSHDYKIGAFFDSNVEELLCAMSIIGGGGLESSLQIADLLSGTCRSFLEAKENQKKWKTE